MNKNIELISIDFYTQNKLKLICNHLAFPKNFLGFAPCILKERMDGKGKKERRKREGEGSGRERREDYIPLFIQDYTPRYNHEIMGKDSYWCVI